MFKGIIFAEIFDAKGVTKRIFKAEIKMPWIETYEEAQKRLMAEFKAVRHDIPDPIASAPTSIAAEALSSEDLGSNFAFMFEYKDSIRQVS